MTDKRQDIQGLRGWAIVMVVLFHFFPKYCPNGYIGVDVFFVISGYLIAMVLEKHERMDIHAIGTFYYKRIRRILPLYYLVIILIMTAILLYPHPIYEAVNSDSSWKAVLLISDFKLRNMDKEYKQLLTEAEDLFTHLWSLCVEMHFYLLVPVGFAFQRSITVWRKTFFIGVALCSLVFYSCTDEMISFYWVFSRIWQFSCGIIAFFARQEKTAHGALSEGLSETDEKVSLIQTEEGDECLIAHDGKDKQSQIAPLEPHPYTFFISTASFFLVTAPALLWKSINTHILRIVATISSATLIYIGSFYETILLSHYTMAYIGNISYALYLFHWPIYGLFKNAYCNTFIGMSLGIIISAALATITYRYYESYYLKWSPPVIFALIVILSTTSCILCYRIYKNGHISRATNGAYDGFNPEDAAWNKTLRLYLNELGGDHENNMKLTFCSYSPRFLNKTAHPYGLCSRQNGTGPYNMLVIGNSFACNQGELVYNSFKKYSRKFSVFCLPACEMMTKSKKKKKCMQENFNYSTVIDALKPDVIFVVSRAFMAKQKLDTIMPLSEDKIVKDYMKRMRDLEATAKKVYLLQALPSCKKRCSKSVLRYAKASKNMTDIEGQLVDQDEFYARVRIAEIGRRCKRCEIVDYMPVLVDDDGRYLGFDPKTNLLFIDNENHFTPFGKDRIQTVYNDLAEKFDSVLYCVENKSETEVAPSSYLYIISTFIYLTVSMWKRTECITSSSK